MSKETQETRFELKLGRSKPDWDIIVRGILKEANTREGAHYIESPNGGKCGSRNPGVIRKPL